MTRLTELGIKHNTDKAYSHHFTDFYDLHLRNLMFPNLLEIGVLDGGSLRMWKEYFGPGLVVGMDQDDKSGLALGEITTCIGNQENPSDLLKCLAYADAYDVIVDDGGHTRKQQLTTLATLFPVLKPGGFYILEDLHASFNPHPLYTSVPGELSPYEVLYKLRDGHRWTSPYFTESQVTYLIENCEYVILWSKEPGKPQDHCTSIIRKKESK